MGLTSKTFFLWFFLILYIVLIIFIFVGASYVTKMVFDYSDAALAGVGIANNDQRNMGQMVIVIFYLMFIPMFIISLLPVKENWSSFAFW
jgi:preprotein translocase subunit SecG